MDKLEETAPLLYRKKSKTSPLLCQKTFIRYNGTRVMAGDDDLEYLQVERPVYQQDDLNRETLYAKPSSHMIRGLKDEARKCCSTSCILKTIPVLEWLPEYSWKKSFLSDVVAGITVAIMHIPQGMAYGLLGNVPPIVGIYMAFFPVLVYFFFGTSRHVSMGTFAVICLMTGKVVTLHATEDILQNGTRIALEPKSPDVNHYTNMEVATTVTFGVAILQMTMYIFRLGIVSTLLSETLVSGFTCAAAFHVVASQLKDLLGLPIAKRRGLFSLLLTVYDCILAIPQANRYVLIVTLTCCVILTLNKELFKPWLDKRTKMLFPIELVAVVIGTMCSYFMDFKHKYDISVVGEIPTGLPAPVPPAFPLLPKILFDCFVITVVSYTITLSMGIIFAQKLRYEIDSNQELLAMSLSNGVGSFFSCLPVTASLSRSMIQQTVGGVTQLASVVSCFLLLFVLLWIGPCFESLPRCVLASIIVIALQSMLTKVKEFWKYWKLSKWDATVWFVAFVVTAFVDISIGLAAGVVVSLSSIFIQGYKPYTCLLGVVPNTDLYLDVKRYKGTNEIDGIKIFHYCGGLSFASKDSFKNLLYKRIGLDPVLVISQRNKLEENANNSDIFDLNLRCVILDFSALTFVDPAGVRLLRQLQSDYNALDVELYIAGCSGPVFETFKKCDKYEGKDSQFKIFPTIHDSVLFAKAHLLHPKST